jgi:hypothetical protein
MRRRRDFAISHFAVLGKMAEKKVGETGLGSCEESITAAARLLTGMDGRISKIKHVSSRG